MTVVFPEPDAAARNDSTEVSLDEPRSEDIGDELVDGEVVDEVVEVVAEPDLGEAELIDVIDVDAVKIGRAHV